MTESAIGAVADDLTGAMDAAGAFASRGLLVRVLRRPGGPASSLAGVDVACINTQTRNVDPAFALAPVRRAAEDIVAASFDRVYKKIDSTGRGNLAAECAALLEATEAAAVIVCPAFPRLSRTIVNGRLLVHGRLVTQTAAGRDPQAPVTSDSLIELLSLEGELSAAHVTLKSFEAGPAYIAAEVRALVGRGYRAVIVDAETDAHLTALADASKELPDCVLAGSAGLAYAVADGMSHAARKAIEVRTARGPTLVLVGSRHEASRAQMSALADHGKVVAMTMEPGEALGQRKERRAYMAGLLDAVRGALSAGRHVALAWSDSKRHARAVPDPSADAASLDRFAGTLVYGALRAASAAGLVVVGGDTAFGVLSALGAASVDVAGEVEAGVPYGVMADGAAAGTVLVTKAGGFGDNMTLVRALDLVEGLVRPRA